jgi:hypothetical protein
MAHVNNGHAIFTLEGERDRAVAEGVRVLTRVDNGEPCQTSFKRHIFAVFFDLITWGRRQGLLDGLPASFEPSRTRIQMPADPVVEKAGKAIPETVQRQLDAQIDSLGRGFTHGILTPEQPSRWLACERNVYPGTRQGRFSSTTITRRGA